MGADVTTAPISIARAIVPKVAGDAFKVFTRSGTVVGAIAGGGVAIYNIAQTGGSWGDWASLGLGVVGVVSEFTGVGELWDSIAIPVSIGIAVGTVSVDVYNVLQENKTNH